MGKSSGGIRGNRGSRVTYENFYKDTVGQFQMLKNRPSGEPDHVSHKFGSLSDVSSEYWYGKDSKGAYVIRGSDHWSAVRPNPPRIPNDRGELYKMQNNYFRRMTPIASCFWSLKTGKSKPSGKILYGKIYLSGFRKKTGY